MTDHSRSAGGPAHRETVRRSAGNTPEAGDGPPTNPLDWLPWAPGGQPLPDPSLLPPLTDPVRGGGPAPKAGAPPASTGSLRSLLADRLPPTLRGGRLDPSPRGAAALAVVALVTALIVAGLAWRSRPSAVAVPAATSGGVPRPSYGGPGAGPSGPPNAAPSPSPSGSAAEILVDVAGKVRRPGVVRVPTGSRVIDAVEEAGGVLPGTDTTGLALAQRLTDGEQVLVTGRPGPAPAAGAAPGPGGGGGAADPTSGSGGTSSDTPVNLNTATLAQLDALPGVGPVLAQRILDWRTQHGSFTSARQLGEVEGVGQKRLADLLPLVTV